MAYAANELNENKSLIKIMKNVTSVSQINPVQWQDGKITMSHVRMMKWQDETSAEVVSVNESAFIHLLELPAIWSTSTQTHVFVFIHRKYFWKYTSIVPLQSHPNTTLKQTAIPTHRSIVKSKYRHTDTQAHWLMGNSNRTETEAP